MPAKKKAAKSGGKAVAARVAAKRKRLGMGIGFVLVSACMFFLGVLVGRGTAPVQFDIQALQDELLELRQAVEDKRRQMLDSSLPSASKPEDLQFYEALKATGDAAAQDPLQQQLADYQPDPAPSPAADPPTATLPAGETAAAASATGAETVGTAASHAKLTVQVASVRDSRSAGLMVEKLRKKGYPAYSSATRIPGKGVWYRVRIGEFGNRQNAERMLKRLEKDQLKGKVVSRS
jgi:DedD protein